MNLRGSNSTHALKSNIIIAVKVLACYIFIFTENNKSRRSKTILL